MNELDGADSRELLSRLGCPGLSADIASYEGQDAGPGLHHARTSTEHVLWGRDNARQVTHDLGDQPQEEVSELDFVYQTTIACNIGLQNFISGIYLVGGRRNVCKPDKLFEQYSKDCGERAGTTSELLKRSGDAEGGNDAVGEQEAAAGPGGNNRDQA